MDFHSFVSDSSHVPDLVRREPGRPGTSLEASFDESSFGAQARKALPAEIEKIDQIRREAASILMKASSSVIMDSPTSATEKPVKQDVYQKSSSDPVEYPSPIPRPIVIIEDKENPVARIPRAFWASSKLRRHHLRILR